MSEDHPDYKVETAAPGINPKTNKAYTLAESILAIRKDRRFSYIQKLDRGSSGSADFKTVSRDRIIGILREALNEHDIFVSYSVTKASRTDKHTEIWADVTLQKGKTTMVLGWYAQGHDGSDKGPGKAYSYLEKTFLKAMFMVETGENEEAISQSIVDDALRLTDITAPELQTLLDIMKETNTAEESFVNHLNEEKDLSMAHLSELPKRFFPFALASLNAKKGQLDKRAKA